MPDRLEKLRAALAERQTIPVQVEANPRVRYDVAAFRAGVAERLVVVLDELL